MAASSCFGVLVDRTFTPIALPEIFNIEAFNRFLSDVTGEPIECAFRRYSTAPGAADLPVQVVLVPRRRACRPTRLNRDLDKYTTRVRSGCEIVTKCWRLVAGIFRCSTETAQVFGTRVSEAGEPCPPLAAQFSGDDGRIHWPHGAHEEALGLASPVVTNPDFTFMAQAGAARARWHMSSPPQFSGLRAPFA